MFECDIEICLQRNKDKEALITGTNIKISLAELSNALVV
jgi:hypothetical protein